MKMYDIGLYCTAVILFYTINTVLLYCPVCTALPAAALLSPPLLVRQRFGDTSLFLLKMAPGRAACGRKVHGKPGSNPGEMLCYACGRAGIRDYSSDIERGWNHVCATPFWCALREWEVSIGGAWTHARDLTTDPLKAGECVCARGDCVDAMYRRFLNLRKKTENGSMDNMIIGSSWCV